MGNSARTPRGINHVVLNVTNLEVSHRFWTETMGFRCVAALKQEPGRPRPKMRFYSGVDSSGDVTHHDLALMEIKAPATNGGKSDKLLLEKDGPIGWIVFNQPEKRNAVSQEMWELMPEYVNDLAKDEAIRVVILRGGGDQSFVSGADISQFKDKRKNMADEEE